MNYPQERWDALGASIRARMAERAMSQVELVRESGVSSFTVRRLMKGEANNYRADRLQKVSRALGWPPDRIVDILSATKAEASDVPTVEQAIEADPDLTDQIKDVMVAFYRSALEQSRKAE